ncbi:(2Fe-2S)-binding protein [Pandoraea terrae]|uniref:(2Fe-2S)-binding protein n=1 Tax=Pandoraea terrae TaxID=1537710 RepID=A0A5E4TMM6_9BURK|nr:(2Fe-2S)-binding protein [Pandoraea terrae]VVD88522.1 (2Fe-2S)-binding protein [Pandoraea terrae]
MTTIKLNGKTVVVRSAPDTPLLWVLRDELKMFGTKFGCGISACGACTVHLDGNSIRACSYPLSAVAGRNVTTIEAMEHDRIGRAVEAAWIKHDVPQCGYCQSGQVMTAVAFLRKNPHPTEQEVVASMGANLCRCGTYQRIKDAVLDAASSLA